jgi:hypothetical protein
MKRKSVPCLRGARRSIADDVFGIFHWHNDAMAVGVDSASNRNEYFLGVKMAGA